MTDNAIIEVSTESLLAELSGLGPKPTASNRLELASVRVLQSMSQAVKDGKAKAGDFIISFGKSAIQPPIYTSELRVMAIDDYHGRVMWELLPNGQKNMAAKDPICSSNDTLQPRRGHYDYIGKTYTDYRPDRNGEIIEWTITDSCEHCPLKEFKPAYAFNKGKLVVNAEGKPVDLAGKKVKSLKPPCQLTQNHVIFLVDYGIPAILRASSPTVRLALRELPGFFAESATGGRPFIRNGQPYAVKITTVFDQYKDNGSPTVVPKMVLDDSNPLDISVFKAYVTLVKKYEEYNVREALTSPERNEYNADDEEEREVADTPVPAASEASKSKLGKGGKRKIETEDLEDPFADE